MDIKDTIACMLNDGYIIESYEKGMLSKFHWFSFTINNGIKKIDFTLSEKQGHYSNHGIYNLMFLNGNIYEFSEAFNMDLTDLS